MTKNSVFSTREHSRPGVSGVQRNIEDDRWHSVLLTTWGLLCTLFARRTHTHTHRCRLTLGSIYQIMITCDTNSNLNCAFCEGSTVMFLSFLCGELSYDTSANKWMVFWGWFAHLKRKFCLVIIYYLVVESFCRLLPIGANNRAKWFSLFPSCNLLGMQMRFWCWWGRKGPLCWFTVFSCWWFMQCIRVADRLFQWFGHRCYSKTYAL